MTRRLILFFIVSLLGVTATTLWITRGGDPQLMAEALARLEPAAGNAEAIGGAFSLTDQNGKPVTDKNFDGKLKLVFFGFTSCPDICPVTLATITSVMNHLGPKANQVTPIFITIDPKHDTPERMKAFLKDFSPAIVGLTGSKEQIAKVAKEYKVYYAPTDHDAVDHSALVYFMGKGGEYLGHFSPEESEKSMLDAIQARLD